MMTVNFVNFFFQQATKWVEMLTIHLPALLWVQEQYGKFLFSCNKIISGIKLFLTNFIKKMMQLFQIVKADHEVVIYQKIVIIYFNRYLFQ